MERTEGAGTDVLSSPEGGRRVSADLVSLLKLLMHIESLEPADLRKFGPSIADLRKDERIAMRTFIRGLVLSPNEFVRAKAIDLISELGPHSDSRAIRLGMKDESWYVRCSAIEAAVICYPKTALRELPPMLADGHFVVRRIAALGLYDLEGAKIAPLIQEYLRRESHPNAKAGMLGVLIRCGDSFALEEIRTMLESNPSNVQELIVDILEEAMPKYLSARADLSQS